MMAPLCRWPLLQHPRSLPDRQPRPRPPLNETLKDTLGLGEAVPSEQQFLDPLTVFAPLLNLVEASPVGIEWIVEFLREGQSIMDNLHTLALSLKTTDWAIVASAVATAVVAVFAIVLACVGRRQIADTRILQRAYLSAEPKGIEWTSNGFQPQE